MKIIRLMLLFTFVATLSVVGNGEQVMGTRDQLREELLPATRQQGMLQRYPSLRKMGVFTVGALVHISALAMVTDTSCTDDKCVMSTASTWLSLVPTLCNMGSTAVSLWDERNRVLEQAKKDHELTDLV